MFSLRPLESIISVLFLFFITFVSVDPVYAWWMWTPGDTVDSSSQSLFSKGYHPKQPIPTFSHRIHAGERRIPCEYCHSSARRSPVAGIPPLNTCMGCHKIVNTDAEPIKKITKLFEEGKSIDWVKVNDLPDFVRFSHQPHVLAKDVQGKPLLSCSSCHGEVQGMGTVEQWAPLQMGWCLDCHNKVKIPAHDGLPAVRYAPTSCNTCHF
ncbi:MAG: cytochrome c3 family protein [Oligoflexales bacterium]|nr:cytochrome c3 family protein [Oligoflexales bacterium]